MITEVATFTCSICGEPSHEICVFCTKDACHNHQCRRCHRCSDCCECEVPLSELEPEPEPEVHAETPALVAEHTEPHAVPQAPATEATEEPEPYNPAVQVIENPGESVHPTISEATSTEPLPVPEEPGPEHR